jgi:hypothetical protein
MASAGIKTNAGGTQGVLTMGGSDVLTWDGSGNVAGVASINGGQLGGFRNRIINGDMRIDQRFNGGNTTTVGYTIDRWKYDATQSGKFTLARNFGTVNYASGGFPYVLGAQCASAYSVLATDAFQIYQTVEGYNIQDFAWGTANAKTVTLSFWINSSQGGTIGGSIRNGAGNRSYPFLTPSLTAATWTKVSITIPGDTSGTWTTDSSLGLYVTFSLGAGANYSGTANTWAAGNYPSATGAVSVVGTTSATLFVTGVQLEVGSTATAFEQRPYQTELALCQRYYEKGRVQEYFPAGGTAYIGTSKPFAVVKRITPTIATTDASSNANKVTMINNAVGGNVSNIAFFDNGSDTTMLNLLYTGGVTTYYGMTYNWTASAEL